ncbi:type II secretion system F family protein [Ferrimonas lipolytica]|uniref:Type II secretion system F family protein n=1 Tax=Ferrimonas lipolytica TaxID=2724191 RepID=A0A6H1UI96_9GAMM|nr:type II secretion system F family protein [Ferrimonas lipolytica]QIZ78548.1 type II secretion system F family protein [Ferrimonas lipolytica]
MAKVFQARSSADQRQQKKAKLDKSKKAEVSDFVWSGKNQKGNPLKGELRGASINEVKAILRSQGVTPLKVARKPRSLFQKKSKITSKDIAVVTRQIATMLMAGVPLVTGLDMVAKGHENEAMRKLLGKILEEIQAGTPVAQALRPHREHFDELYCDLVSAGEQSGTLDSVFDRIATYREKSEALKSKIKKAMFYPVAVVTVAIIVTLILLIFVVPQFEAIFNDFGAELPAFTQMVIGLSKFIQSSWYYFLGVAMIIVWLYKRAYHNSPEFRDKVDVVLLKIPVVGNILHKGAMAKFARTLATTFAAGVPLVEGLDASAGASGNAVYRKGILKMKEEVVSGLQMNIAMRTVNLFPDMVTQMVMIGEESGALDDMLNKVANIFEMEVDDAVDGLSTLIEPLLMVVLGVLVGGLIIAMYLPIFELGNVVG